MCTIDPTNTTAALNALQSCRRGLLELRLDANTAADALTGARASRARELVEKIGDVIAHCQRLEFFVEGDLHAEDVADAAIQQHPAGKRRERKIYLGDAR